MKIAIVLVALVVLSSSAPQPRRDFHEHVEDFLDVIMEEAGVELERIVLGYMEFEEFRKTVNYFTTTNFRELINEMGSLPEFKAVINFLENDNIDIHYFFDRLNEMIDQYPSVSTRQTLSGTDFHSYMSDVISIFPKAKLAALFDEKMEDEEFRTAINNLYSDEWKEIFGALWENDVFLNEVEILASNGVILQDLLNEIIAIFGQN